MADDDHVVAGVVAEARREVRQVGADLGPEGGLAEVEDQRVVEADRDSDSGWFAVVRHRSCGLGRWRRSGADDEEDHQQGG